MANNRCLRYIKNVYNIMIFLLQLVFIVILTYVIFPFINTKVSEKVSVILCCIIQVLFTISSLIIYCKTKKYISNIIKNNEPTYIRI